MNILFITNYYPDQNEPHCIFIHQQAQALVALGHNVEVIVPYEDRRHPLKVIKKQIDHIPVSYFSGLQLYKEIYSPILKMINVRCLEKLFDFDKFNIISFHMFDENALRIFLKIAKKHCIKTFIHYHGLTVLYDHILPMHVRILQYRGSLVLKKLLEKADTFIGVSDLVCTHIRKVFPNNPVFTVYNGVDTALFQPLMRNRKKEFSIISVAGLKKIKGNHYLIEAVKMLSEKHKDYKIILVIIGRGPEEASLKAQVKEDHLEHLVYFAGYLKYEDVVKLMQQGDVFAMPSYYEAFGCAYLEAMACRLPVIGCYHQGIEEIITDGFNGYLIEPHNVYQLYEKLEMLLLDPVRSENMAENGYRTVINSYTWLDSAKRLLEVYQKLCKLPGGSDGR